MTEIYGFLAILIICPILGGLPLIDWITYSLTGRKLSQLGTGNISVSAAFYHGGKIAGILAVLSEAGKGIGAVLLARYFFAQSSVWELVALIALVMGRYWFTKGAGTTNVTWGILVHDPISAILVFLISGVSFTIIRERQTAKFSTLILLGLILSLRHPYNGEYVLVAITLCALIGWIYRQIPDDLNLSPTESNLKSQKMFKFFRGDKSLISLNQVLTAEKVGQKAANLSQLKEWGYPVAEGWVLLLGDDAQPLIDFLDPSLNNPLVVRSSVIGEDSELASAAGQYLSILNVTHRETLKLAIVDCLGSYQQINAAQYRSDKKLPDIGMAVLVQKQIRGIFSGVAFSRNPVNQLEDCVLIEALPGDATQVVQGKVTPRQYKVFINDTDLIVDSSGQNQSETDFIKEIAKIARELEQLYQGIPQDIEWTYDGEQLWLLQTRPITNLQPTWTRKIAAEVIPGFIRPLTWSINKPLTCGVWGELFSLVLGKRSQGLDFNQTATLHYHRAYFNATLLGQIFLKMGLPPESLEFLTRNAKFSKPPLKSSLINLRGLGRLLGKELKLEADFAEDYHNYFAPLLREIKASSAQHLTTEQLLEIIEKILSVLKKATYYSILAPLSFAIRKAIFKIADTDLDNNLLPEIESMKSLAKLAQETRLILPKEEISDYSCASLFAHLAEIPDGENILQQFDKWLNNYGYLGDVATDIAIPRWKEDPRHIRQTFTHFLLHEPTASSQVKKSGSWKIKLVQKRLNLKGRVTKIYSQLLAHLRWMFLGLEEQLLANGIILEKGDIFFLELTEIHELVKNTNSSLKNNLKNIIQTRKFQLEKSREITNIPFVVYGNPSLSPFISSQSISAQKSFQGIGASAGIVEGKVRILSSLENITHIDKETILVVNYTDSGWTAVLTRAGGIIAEVGGSLSHGAIIAREYGIPAVMNIENATHLFKNNQRVRINGQTGLVEIID